jgi:non-ribosomal peptide synthase protein (TIGR01720 family)
MSADDVFLQLAPISFDASTFEIWGCLLNGGRLVIMPAHTPSLEELGQALQRYQVTTLWLTAGLFHLMVDERLEDLQLVPQLLAGGDVLSVAHVLKVLRAPGTRSVINGYGPTENTTFTCCFPMTTPGQVDSTVPIGRPIANTQVYLLDRQLQPVPIGVAGDLYIGGAGLARDYLHRPALTAASFLPHPWSTLPGTRLYKTGDLARYKPNGTLEFVGRRDAQVKLRGFRIELGEIETVLGQHPTVHEVVSVVREDQPGARRLVAYIVPQPNHRVQPEDLRRFAQAKLPAYMVPVAFILLEALPLTPNGKVDRGALPALELTRHKRDGTREAPRTPTEALLGAIWADVLGLEEIGRDDNFFELGGDSILSIQIIARATQAGLRLTPKQLFQHQSIAALAAVAVTTHGVQAEQGLVTGVVPLTPIQQWFFEQVLPAPQHFNQSVLLEVPPDLQPALLVRVVQALLWHHDALRLRFMPTAAGWQQAHTAPDIAIPLCVVDLAAVAPTVRLAALTAIAASVQASLHLTKGPLLRVVFFALGEGQPGRLLVVVHHLVVDGVSWRILLEDLATVYQQLCRGEAVQLPAKTTSFQAWAARLTAYGQAPELAATAAYWLAAPPASGGPLPVDQAADPAANTVAAAAHVAVALSPEETWALLHEVPPAYNTQITEVLMTALAQSMAPWTEQDVLLVDLEGHGREDLFEEVDVSRTVGWFTTVFPVWVDLRGRRGPGEALQAVKEQLRGLPQRGLSYGVLRYLSPNVTIREALQDQPRAEVSFNYLGQFDQVVADTSLFRLAGEARGREHSPQGRRRYVLEVAGWVVGGQLQMGWSYSERLHQRATVERLAAGFLEALRALIAHCQSPTAGGYTPSDFPDVELSQEQLDQILAEIDLDSVEEA